MRIDAREYDRMKAWFAHLVPLTVAPEFITAETDPIACLERMESRWPGKARSGLAMTIGDTIEMTDGWPASKVEETDQLLAADGLPTLSEMRVRFSKVIRRVLNRGHIKDEVEYYALRNAAELSHDGA